ncbi:MAG: hypothetical protein M1831_003113 [Alyxoria varia]|nr:MAG: hypothetical protein M1831_003113 [Alyxoria varia]
MPPYRRGPLNLYMLPRRFVIAFVLAIGFAVLLIIFAARSPVTIPPVPEPVAKKISESAQHAADVLTKPKLPKLYNPFANDAHSPPEQANSTHGDTKWYSDLKWLNPFSSLVTLDNERAVLPPLNDRPTIYTYYETRDKNSKIVEAEHKLLLTWRRAWWAQGFRPVVLGKAESKKNPLYRRLQQREMGSALQKELERWLAWEYMGGGILANWLVLPMHEYEDELLSSLRSSKFERLTRFKGLEMGLFVGKKREIGDAIKQLLENKEIKPTTPLVDALPRKTFHIDSRHSSIAYYDMPTIKSKYSRIADQLGTSLEDGYTSLQQLINAHLQTTWLNAFPDGVAILKPYPDHMTTLTSFAMQIAQTLTTCHDIPIPKSCPPNRPSCKPCSSHRPHKLRTVNTYENKTSLFTIGTVAHPYTFNSLYYYRETVDTPFVRRKTARDQWLAEVTDNMLGPDISGPQRLVRFKEAVASGFGAAHSLWLTGEHKYSTVEPDWVFGFEMPKIDPGALALLPPNLDSKDNRPPAMDKVKEERLMELAQKIILAKSKKEQQTREMVEGWNLADSEAWRFVRAFGTRRKVERERWEEDEKGFAGGERSRAWFR